jgi:hypothetical protein
MAGEGILPLELELVYHQIGYVLWFYGPGGICYPVPHSDWCAGDDVEHGTRSIDELVVQIGTHDFDQDGIDEIVVAHRFGYMDIEVTVIKFHPPGRLQDFTRPANWEVHGPFQGQFEAFIDKSHIVLPFGSVGLFWEYTFVRDKFIKTSDG